MAQRANKITEQNRVKEVMALLLVGTMRFEIVQTLSDKWKCTESNVDDYIQKAKLKFKDHWEGELKEDILAKHNMLYNQALISGDKKEARANLENIAKLSGHHTTKVEHSGIIDIPTQIIIGKIDDETKTD